jgi:adenosylhomocysteinase
MPYKIRDEKLAPQGRLMIEWAESRMPVTMQLRRQYAETKPLKGFKIGGCLHITKETAVLVEALKDAGAEAVWSGCNPLSTQDEVAAALVEEGTDVYGWHGVTTEEYYWCIDQVLAAAPQITLDDGADLTVRLHQKLPDQAGKTLGGTEETTTGVHRLRAMASDGKLRYPIVAVNDAETKWDFDNVYGTGQSALDGILRATNILLAGKNFVIAGYGHGGRGLASRARGMGAHVIVCEVDAIKALKAVMDGFIVSRMRDAAKVGDIFITVTGCKDVIRKEHFAVMKNGAVLANAGHFNVEVSVEDLESLSQSKRLIRPNNVEYTLKDGRRLFLLADGRLVNLAAAEGHPSEVMDMSFANQFLSLLFIAKNHHRMKPRVYEVSERQDKKVAQLKLRTMGLRIDKLSEDQRTYLASSGEGT